MKIDNVKLFLPQNNYENSNNKPIQFGTYYSLGDDVILSYKDRISKLARTKGLNELQKVEVNTFIEKGLNLLNKVKSDIIQHNANPKNHLKNADTVNVEKLDILVDNPNLHSRKFKRSLLNATGTVKLKMLKNISSPELRVVQKSEKDFAPILIK